MKIDDIKLKIENLGYAFYPPNYTKIGCEVIGMKEYKVTMYHIELGLCTLSGVSLQLLPLIYL